MKLLIFVLTAAAFAVAIPALLGVGISKLLDGIGIAKLRKTALLVIGLVVVFPLILKAGFGEVWKKIKVGLLILFSRADARVQGEYFERVNGGEWVRTENLIVNEGLAHILNVALGTTAKPTGYYLALFSGATAPAANWTAANFASVASEIVSTTEGYTSATRQLWTPTNTTGNSIDNITSVASVTIATASQLNVTGAAMLTNSTRGGTTGVLISATKYASTRTFQNGDIYEIGYRLSLTV